MSVSLLDINVLVAIFDPEHQNHESAHEWLNAHGRQGWATCPLTVNGFVRVGSSPAYRSIEATPQELLDRLHEFCAEKHHQFWPDSVNLTDTSLFRASHLVGHKLITDIYLLGLAVRNRGRLVTFNRSIPVRAVHGATASSIVFLGSS